MAVSALTVAKFFLAKADEEEELIDQLKLQKLLYYAQGFSLVLLDRPLFDESLLAWEHGPVVREVWDEYKVYGRSSIPASDDVPDLPADIEELLGEVWSVYGQFSSWRLRQMTHETPPWIETPRNGIITPEKMAAFFVTQVV